METPDWITDRAPEEKDADPDKSVLMLLNPHGLMGYKVHWSFVAKGAPWKHTSDWKPPTPRVLLGINGQWISGEVKPLESEAVSYGHVQIRESNGDTTSYHWDEITSGHTWRPYSCADTRPVVLATVTTKPECRLPGKFGEWIDGADLLPTVRDANNVGNVKVQYRGDSYYKSWNSISLEDKWRPLLHLDPRPKP